MPRKSTSNRIPVTPKMILKAWNRLEGVIIHTPLIFCQGLSDLVKCSVSVKWECLQRTGVFKIRGAYNKVASLSSKAAEKGVITASTGNHGLAVAYAANQRGIPATVVVPVAASSLKVDKCKRYGAKVVVHGTNYDEAASHSVQLANETGATLVHAYADPEVIAGQGTVGIEVLNDLPECDVLLVPVGG
ncbi:MAG: threonine/serine dehydratase, partial [Promethearchaeota archaeon]